MREVSCRALGVVLKEARRREISETILIDGTEHDLAYLRNTKNRIDWSTFCKVLKNGRAVWSLEEFSKLNETFMRSPFFAYVGVIARLLFTSRDLFDWICKRSVGGGAQLFSNCVKPSFEHVGADCTIIRLEIQDPYATSPEFFWMTRGAFVAMPRLVGSGSAEVDMEIDNRLATYRVRYRNKRGTFSSLVRWITWPFTARTAAKELKRTNEELQSRFYELEHAQERIDRQRRMLDSAYRLGQRIWSQRDVDSIGTTVTGSLIELDSINGARLAIEPATTIESGIVDTNDTIAVDLPGEPSRGRLYVWTDRPDVQILIDLLAPTIALAIDNAIAYRELAEYQRGLEELVEKRTGELRNASVQLAATVEQLREAQGARERFFGNISHEIRTPLSLILLATADIEANLGSILDDRRRAALATVNDSARKLLRLVDELLLLASGEVSKLGIRPEAVDVGRLIAATGSAWLPAAENAGLDLMVSTPVSLVAMVDPTAIERVATNLVSNAIKYTPRGGRVELSLEEVEARFVLEVRDTGVGIDADLRARLFGRFERAKNDQRRTGSGIGLSLVKQLVEAHGGTIDVEPRDGGGSTFRVSIPCGEVSAVGDPIVAPRLGPADYGFIDGGSIESGAVLTPSVESRGTILIAEDDPKLASMIAGVLAAEYTVVVGLDGIKALDLVKKHHPHLLVTDVEMPGMDGIELSRRFRAATGDRLAPIVILSAVMDLGTRVAGLEAGAVDYVLKPFDPRELLARVRAQFRMRELALRLHRAEQLSAMGTLAAGLAHELRNPANGIVNAIMPLRRLIPPEVIDPSKPAGQLFDVVSGCAEQVASLSRHLLSFRNREGKLDLREVGLADIVQRAISLASGALRGVDVRKQLDGLATIKCAPPLLTQVLTNLVENAGHAAGTGGWIEIAARAEGGRITLEIADSGPGVPPDLRDRVFEPFFTTKAPGVGTGLGLPLARDIVHRHGGVLEIRERGQRPVFVVDLPQ